MVTSIFYTSARQAIQEFMEAEFATLGSADVEKLISSFYKFLNYEEEGVKIRPTIFVTSNIHVVQKTIPDTVEICFYEDENSNNFNQRLKSLMVFCLEGWSIYINYGPKNVQYGIIKALNSVKDLPLEKLIFDRAQLVHGVCRPDKCVCNGINDGEKGLQNGHKCRTDRVLYI